MKVLLILSSIIAFAALGLEVKYYQRKSISSSTISKQVAYPSSDIQCCQACSDELDCDGVKYDGNICSLLKEVKISNGSDESVEEEAWVNFELTCKKGHCGNRCQNTGGKCCPKDEKLNDCRGFCTTILHAFINHDVLM